MARRGTVERALSENLRRLVAAREELKVLDEQLAVVNEVADDLRVDSLVSETPLATHDYDDARRHAETVTRARDALRQTFGQLERRQDELLGQLDAGPH